MLAVQPRLPFAVPFRPRTRKVRRPFTPSATGLYILPRDVRDRLTTALAPYRNRDAAFALAVFLARFWSAPGRIVGSFPVDRRALADHPDLGLTEAQVRGAIRALEEVGFLDRALAPSGSAYKATPDGLQRKPIAFIFGSDYARLLIAANNRAAVARGGHSRAERAIPAEPARRPSTAFPVARCTNSPKSKSEADNPVLMGEIRKSGIPPRPLEPDPALEAALDRLRQGVFGKAGAVDETA